MSRRKPFRMRWCRKCGSQFKATGKWCFVCDACDTRGKQGGRSPVIDLRYIDLVAADDKA